MQHSRASDPLPAAGFPPPPSAPFSSALITCSCRHGGNFQTMPNVMPARRMNVNGHLGKMWKEAAVACIRYYLEEYGLRKPTNIVRKISLLDDNQTWDVHSFSNVNYFSATSGLRRHMPVVCLCRPKPVCNVT
jgi:hypothetical protein